MDAMYLLALLVSLAPAQAEHASVLLEAMKPVISATFPTVSWIDIQALKQNIEAQNRKQHQAKLIILDTRSPEEWAISHLPHAIHLPHDATDFSILGQDKNQNIVVYCSVAYRSAELADRLMKAGYTKVTNLEGGIFAWANAGLPMIKNKKSTALVHPYNKKWGLMLKANLHAKVTPIK